MWSWTLPQLSARVKNFTHAQGSHLDWEMGRHFPVREKHKLLENSGIFRQILFVILVIFKWTAYLLKYIKFSVKKKNKLLKNTGKMEKKYWKSQGILSVWKSGDYDAINKPDKAREKGGWGWCSNWHLGSIWKFMGVTYEKSLPVCKLFQKISIEINIDICMKNLFQILCFAFIYKEKIEGIKCW